MKINTTAGERGFIRTILLIIVILLVISYFGINLRQLVSSPTTQDNMSYAWSTVMYIWDSFLKVPATALWNFFMQYVWTSAVSSIQHGHMSIPSTISSSTPGL